MGEHVLGGHFHVFGLSLTLSSQVLDVTVFDLLR
jgi:hypothetical protein